MATEVATRYEGYQPEPAPQMPITGQGGGLFGNGSYVYDLLNALSRIVNAPGAEGLMGGSIHALNRIQRPAKSAQTLVGEWLNDVPTDIPMSEDGTLLWGFKETILDTLYRLLKVRSRGFSPTDPVANLQSSRLKYSPYVSDKPFEGPHPFENQLSMMDPDTRAAFVKLAEQLYPQDLERLYKPAQYKELMSHVNEQLGYTSGNK